MKSHTKSVITHRTSLMPDAKATDGGRALLIEAFDFIRGERQVGRLVAAFGPGGAIRALSFEEEEGIAQKDISFGG